MPAPSARTDEPTASTTVTLPRPDVVYRPTTPSVRVVIAQSPSPAIAGTSLALMGKLRALVGQRDKTSTHVGFVVATLRALGARISTSLAGARTGDELDACARRHHALTSSRRPRLGDLVVFDNFLRKQPRSMTGIVVSIDQRGTIEFIYLARKIVRRGFLNLQHPSTKRDASGRVLNTILRHLQGGDSRRTKYLAGELFAGFISLHKLTR